MLTRFAPTPSGYLHVGNAANALLVARLADAHAGAVALRIDDVDAARSRPEYVHDVFDLLEWLGVTWQVGPRDAGDFTAHWSQSLRVDRYRQVLDSATTLPTYACVCSRRDLTGPATGGCARGCRTAGHLLTPGISALRAVVPEGTTIDVDGAPVRLDAVMGDFVVWRRDDLPAYQLASVVDDVDLGITHVVRGTDLRESTAAQRFLAAGLGLDSFAAVQVIHHGLVAGPDGGKLSKSQVERGRPLPRTDATRAAITALADELGAPVGLTG